MEIYDKYVDSSKKSKITNDLSGLFANAIDQQKVVNSYSKLTRKEFSEKLLEGEDSIYNELISEDSKKYFHNLLESVSETEEGQVSVILGCVDAKNTKNLKKLQVLLIENHPATKTYDVVEMTVGLYRNVYKEPFEQFEIFEAWVNFTDGNPTNMKGHLWTKGGEVEASKEDQEG